MPKDNTIHLHRIESLLNIYETAMSIAPELNQQHHVDSLCVVMQEAKFLLSDLYNINPDTNE